MTSTREQIGVLCVEDNDLVAHALERKLRSCGLRWLERLPTADGLLEAVARTRPQVVLLDVDMPGADVFEAMSEVHVQYPESRILIFSGHVRPQLLERAIECGAWGYISKSDGEGALVQGILDVSGGEFVLSTEVRAIAERG